MNIEKEGIDYDFLEEDARPSRNEPIMHLIRDNPLSENEDYKRSKSEKIGCIESQRKVDEFLRKGLGDEEDYDELKILSKQIKMLKDEIKENRLQFQQLSDQVKILIKNIKCDTKIKPQIVQICQILGFSPQTTSRIVTNNKKNLNF